MTIDLLFVAALLFVGMSLLFGVTRTAFADSPAIRAKITQIIANPPKVTMDGPNARFKLLIDGKTADGFLVDLTRDATFESNSDNIVRVSPTGLLHAVADGSTGIAVTYGQTKLNVVVTVRNATVQRRFNFENDIIPIMSKFGCNASGCHGKAEGQNGFKLSVFGFDPQADRRALIQEGRGRRVFPAIPASSLLLTKASGGIPHGGGVRIRRNSLEYKTLHDWIVAGMPSGSESDPKVVSLNVTPDERRMPMESAQQLRAVATYSDGRQADVTAHAKFQSNSDTLAGVDEFGLVNAGDNPGEVAIMATYMGAVDVFRILIPRPSLQKTYPQPPSYNFIDKLVDAKLKKLNIVPSEICSDGDFLRRAYLDVIGTLPETDEARRFLSDKRPDRRSRLVTELLQRPEFADFWALKWADLLRVDRQQLGHKAAYNYYKWIRESFAKNKPYDQFARELIAPEGLLTSAPSGHIYKVIKSPGEVASAVSQIFLGIRIECARCHHHPFDRWSQTDYYGMQALFTQVSFKATPAGEMLIASKSVTTKHPRTQAVVYAHPLTAPIPVETPDGDRRRHLVDWMTAPDNPWFAQNFVNRAWAHFAGRGLIEPVDDVRSTNPPTNPELLNALSKHFIESGFNFHDLIRTITASRTYQLSSAPNETNERDEQNYSRALFKQLGAEVLFDAVCQTTGVPEKFRGVPSGFRAIQLWDSRVPHYFLRLFGRPFRVTPCECERSSEPNVAQVLHVLNSPGIHDKLSHEDGRIAKLVRNQADNGKLADELFLAFYARFPTNSEQAVAIKHLNSNALDRRKAAEDIAWSMMNTLEFLFNH